MSNNKRDQIYRHWLKKWFGFIAFGVYLFLLIQKILMPNWNWPQNVDNLAWSIENFYNLENDSEDIVFVGASHIMDGISPMEIYRDYGIVSYNLATLGQPVDMSYLMLKEMFKTQSPSYVVIDASMLFHSENSTPDYARRYVLDSLRLSKEKVDAAKKYSEMADDLSEKEKVERFNSVIFPIISYHSNWKTLVKGNFEFEPKSNYCTFGYSISSYKTGAYTDKNSMDSMIEDMKNDNVQHGAVKKANGEIEIIENESILYRPTIPSKQYENINLINELCKENNSKLLIVKVPVVAFPYIYGGAWSKDKSKQVRTLAEDLGVDFFDMNYDIDVELDLANDFIDSGAHLNYRGAVVVSDCMGEYLYSTYGLGGKTSSYMDENMDNYERLAKMARLELEPDFLKYCQFLQEDSEDYIVCISAKEYWKNALLEDDYTALKILGLYDDIKGYSEFGNSYLAIIDGGNIEYEEISNRGITYEYVIDEENSITIKSFGAMAGNSVEIYVNDAQIAMNVRGLNIVVIDKATNKIIDSCCIDTNVEGRHDVAHNGNGVNYMFDCVYGED